MDSTIYNRLTLTTRDREVRHGRNWTGFVVCYNVKTKFVKIAKEKFYLHNNSAKRRSACRNIKITPGIWHCWIETGKDVYLQETNGCWVSSKMHRVRWFIM